LPIFVMKSGARTIKYIYFVSLDIYLHSSQPILFYRPFTVYWKIYAKKIQTLISPYIKPPKTSSVKCKQPVHIVVNHNTVKKHLWIQISHTLCFMYIFLSSCFLCVYFTFWGLMDFSYSYNCVFINTNI
jgi:hypothetical protein